MGALVMLGVVVANPASASVATTAPAARPASPGGIGVRLLDAPTSAAPNARAPAYIDDHLAPGSAIHRQIAVSNTTGATAHVVLYSSGATDAHGSFLGDTGHTPNDLSTWTSVSPGVGDIPAQGQLTATVTVTVPSDAAPGEQYAAVWAEVRSAPVAGAGTVVQVSRVGIRLYVTVGSGNAPASNFAVTALTARRTPAGQPQVVATVVNTGGRALDMSGSLQLSGGPAGLRAGPFPATLGISLAPGQTEPVTSLLSQELPAGPWHARIALRSGPLQRDTDANITFPAIGSAAPARIVPTGAPTSHHHNLLYIVVTGGLLVLIAGIWLVTLERRRHRSESVGADVPAPNGLATVSGFAKSSPSVVVRRPGRGRRAPLTAIALITGCLLVVQLWSCPVAYADTTPPALGTAGSFSVYGQSGVASTGDTTISGDVGVGPASLISGFPPGIIKGTTHSGDPAAAQARSDMETAYSAAAGATPNAAFSGDLNGQTFDAGVYDTSAAFALTGNLTLDGQGDPNAVFIFQVGAAMNLAASAQIVLVNGAQPANVFWQVLGAVNTGASSSLSGTILADGAVTIGADATLVGRALSEGTVTLANNVITTPGVSGQALSISVPTGDVDLGNYPPSVTGETVSGLLGTVEVNDTRDGSEGTGWVASVRATAFTPVSGPAVPASAVSWSAGPITQVRGTASYTDDHPSDLSAPVLAVTATAIAGDNAEASWDPTISVTVPGGLVAGAYTSTVTYSVL